jgi:arabinofuranosyltransferase
MRFRPSKLRAPGGFGAVDTMCLLGVLAVHGLIVWQAKVFAAVPTEVTAIVFRYSRNLAEGHGIVWNIGEHPIDASGNFLFMLLVAALYKAGLGLLDAARALDFIGTAGTIVIAYIVGRVLYRQPRWVSSAAPLFIAVGPAAIFTGLGFSAPFFGFFVALAALLALLTVRRPTHKRALGFGVSSLFMGLVRPEGVLLAALLAGGCLIAMRDRRTLIRGFAVGFCLPGLLYFTARWIYFGAPLPDPYYLQRVRGFHFDGLSALRETLPRWFIPVGILYILPLRRPRIYGRRVCGAALPVAGFLAFCVLLSPVPDRFEYPTLVLVAVSLPGLWAMTTIAWHGAFPSTLLIAVRAGMVLAAGVTVLELGEQTISADDLRSTARYDERASALGSALAPYKSAGRLLAVSESGLVPLNSGWQTLDLSGFNDREIARAGLDIERLYSGRPGVIFIREIPSRDASDPLMARWLRMVRTVHVYIRSTGDYIRVARWEDPTGYGVLVVYMARDMPNSQQVRQAICRAVAPKRHCGPRPQ